MIVQTVREYNRTVKPDQFFYRMTFKNIRTGEDKKTGYVASYKDSHFWAKTKKQAIQNLLEHHPEALKG